MALLKPATEDRRRAAAAALYTSITTQDDAQEQEASGEAPGPYDDDPYGDEAYYEERVYGYDDAHPYAEAEGMTEGDLALQHLRSMLPAPGEKEVALDSRRPSALSPSLSAFSP